jgi:YesN/AraC family two-component response regulator
MKKKLLIVEDNAKLLNSMSALFEDYFDIYEGTNGREGIEKARLHMPDIVISDIMMPEVNGYELVEALKGNDRTSHIPIILLTALGEDERIIEGYNFGADDYIVKPFKFDILLSRVNNVLKSRDQLKRMYDKSTPVHHEFGVKDPLLSHLEALLVNHFRFRDFSIPQIAGLMNMTTPKLEREMKKLTGMTPIQYVNDFRLHKAKDLLLKDDKSIFEVSHSLGFKSLSYFGKAYKEKFGIAPSKTKEV